MGKYKKPDECVLPGGGRICKVEECENKHYARGFCKNHYYQLKKFDASKKRAQKKHQELYKLETQIYNKEYYQKQKKQTLVDSGYEGIVESMKSLSPQKIDLIRDFLVGQAEIIHVDDLRAVETVRKWILRSGSDAIEVLSSLIKSKNTSDKVKLDAAKEILMRIVSARDGVGVKDDRSKKTVDELLDESSRIISTISGVHGDLKNVGTARNRPGRPAAKDDDNDDNK